MKLTYRGFQRCYALTIGTILVAVAAVVGSHPATAGVASLASMLPLAAISPSPHLGDRLRSLVPDPNALTPGVKPYEGRPATTRDIEAETVRMHLKPLNPVA